MWRSPELKEGRSVKFLHYQACSLWVWSYYIIKHIGLVVEDEDIIEMDNSDDLDNTEDKDTTKL